MKRYLGQFYLAAAASIWGGMYVVSKVVLHVVPPLALVWFRYVVALVALALIGWITKRSWRIHRKHLWLIAAIGLIGYAVSIWAQFLGTKLSSAQLGSVITSATPAFMVLFARWLLKEQITFRKILSVALATSGVFVIVDIGAVSLSDQYGGLVLALAALTWALMSVLVKRIPDSYPLLVVTTYAIGIATVALTPFSISEMTALSPGTLAHPVIWGGILYLGLVSTAGAFFLWNRGLQLVEASTAGLYFFFQPLVGTLLGWIILGEHVGAGFWIGSALIIIGVLLVV